MPNKFQSRQKHKPTHERQRRIHRRMENTDPSGSELQANTPTSTWSSCLGCCKCGKSNQVSYLYAFDFDHTIVDQNSDTAVMEIIHNPIPSNLNRLFDGTNWEEYMDGVFKFIAAEGGTYDVIAEKIKELKATEGMPHLLHKIMVAKSTVHSGSKLMVVSDANSFFIETYLSSLKPPVIPDILITNKAQKTEEGHLKLTPYEHQTQCPYCPRNLCKGDALLDYIEKEGPFARVFYTGDGGNDVCPATKLSEDDVVFARKDYAMEKIIKNGMWRGRPLNIRAKVVFWETAKEIQKEMLF